MARINAYLRFDGNCHTAFLFYKDCLGGVLEYQKVGESPMGKDLPREAAEKVLHCSLTSGDLILYGADNFDDSRTHSGTSVTLCYTGASLEELKSVFSSLAEGGEVTHQLQETFFGTYGDLTDKFGINWMFQSDQKKK